MLLPADVTDLNLSAGKNTGSNSLDLLEDVMLEEIDAAANLVNNGKRGDSLKKKSNIKVSVLDKENSSIIGDIVGGGGSIIQDKSHNDE